MTKLQFIDVCVLEKIDRLCLWLSFGYIIAFFLGDIDEALTSFFSIGLLTFSIYLAKKRNKVLYSAFGYTWFSLIIIDMAVGYWEFSFKSYFILIPFLLFVAIMIVEWNSNFLSGFIYGYWIVFTYHLVKLLSELSVIESLQVAFSPSQFQYLLVEYLLLLIIIGIIITLVGKNQSFDFNGYWIEKIDYTLFLMSVGYLLMWIASDYKSEYLIVLIIYGLLTYCNLKAKATEKNMYSAIVYGGITFFIIHFFTELLEAESIYPSIIIAIIVFLIVLRKNVSARPITFLFGVYWFLIFYQMWKASPATWDEGMPMIFHIDSIQQLSQYVNFIGISIALFIFGSFMLKRQKKSSK